MAANIMYCEAKNNYIVLYQFNLNAILIIPVFLIIKDLFMVNMITLMIKYWKPENEFHSSPPWRGRGGFIKKDIHFSGLQYFIIHPIIGILNNLK